MQFTMSVSAPDYMGILPAASVLRLIMLRMQSLSESGAKTAAINICNVSAADRGAVENDKNEL